jgi:ribonuclease-3
MAADLEGLEATLGHTFVNQDLVLRALTHKSRAYERNGPGEASSDNEQLEFLGDSILGFIISEHLTRRYPDYPEGRLSKLKAHLVSAARLHEVAQELELGNHLRLGRGEELSGGRSKRALLADAVEALIAALYLDAGVEVARHFIEQRVVAGFQAPVDGDPNSVTDYKSALQEVAQSRKLPPPRYTIVNEQGPEHCKTFTVEVRLGKDFVSQAQGLSKKSAGQKAAQQILQQLTDWGR